MRTPSTSPDTRSGSFIPELPKQESPVLVFRETFSTDSLAAKQASEMSQQEASTQSKVPACVCSSQEPLRKEIGAGGPCAGEGMGGRRPCKLRIVMDRIKDFRNTRWVRSLPVSSPSVWASRLLWPSPCSSYRGWKHHSICSCKTKVTQS